MKKPGTSSFIRITIFSLLGFIQTVQADFSSDAERIFNDAQQVFSQFFPTAQDTQTLDSWLYRYYPSRDIYIGVNQNDGGVYGLGGVFGDIPVYIDTTQAVQALLQNKKEDSGPLDNNYCDMTPDGIECEQNGYSVNETSNGQCIKVSEDNNAKLETGINVLYRTNASILELKGLTSSIPEIVNFFDDFLISQTNVCAMNVQKMPPDDISNYTINTNMCFDVTDDLNNIAALANKELIEINPPITFHIVGLRVETVVDDCFSSDAKGIFNSLTKESWIKQNGAFVKLE